MTTYGPPEWIDRLPAPQVLARTMGIEIADWNPDRLVATMPVAGNTQPYGIVHGGAYCVLAETLGSTAAALFAGPDRAVVGIELHASYHRSTTSGQVRATCRNIHLGGTLTSHAIEIHDDEDRLLSIISLRCLIRELRPVA